MKHRIQILLGGLIVFAVGPLHGQIITNNLLAWFNADAGVTVDVTGSNVVRWADQSANGNDATQTALNPVNQPALVTNALNGHSVLRFESLVSSAGSKFHFLSLTNNTLDLTAGLSIFIVAKNAGNQNYNGLFRIGPSGSPYAVVSSDLEIYWNNSPSGSGRAEYVSDRTAGGAAVGQQELSYLSSPSVGKYYLLDAIATPSSAQMRVNTNNAVNVYQTATTPNFANWASIGVGYGGDSLHGDIAEIIIYNTNLSVSQRDGVWAYLEGKYALGIPEPSMLALLGLSGVVLILRRRH